MSVVAALPEEMGLLWGFGNLQTPRSTELNEPMYNTDVTYVYSIQYWSYILKKLCDACVYVDMYTLVLYTCFHVMIYVNIYIYTIFWKLPILPILLLMAEILHELIGSLSHYLQGFYIHPRWFSRRISEPSTVFCTVWLLLNTLLQMIQPLCSNSFC